MDIHAHMCVIVHIICIIYEDRHQRADTGGLCEGNVRFCFEEIFSCPLKKKKEEK